MITRRFNRSIWRVTGVVVFLTIWGVVGAVSSASAAEKGAKETKEATKDRDEKGKAPAKESAKGKSSKAAAAKHAAPPPESKKEARKDRKPRRRRGNGVRGVVRAENVLTTSALYNQYRQIVIEGLVVEVDSTEARRWGIDLFYQRTPGSNGGGNLSGAVLHTPNSFPIGGVPTLDTSVNPPVVNLTNQNVGIGATLDGFHTEMGLLQAQIRAAVIDGKANILSQPIAVTQSGTQVELRTVDEIPFQDIVTDGYHITSVRRGEKQLGVVQNDYSTKKAGIILKVTPKLLPPDRVQLDISSLDVGQLAGFIQIRGVARPIIQNSHLETRVELANNESLLISGIKRTQEETERRGIPYLKDIPVLGMLFGSTTVQTERVDILFMITPHLLAPGENPIEPRGFQNEDFLVSQ